MSVFENLTQLMSQGLWIALPLAFLWGIVSMLITPCHLSGIFLLVGFLSKNKENGAKPFGDSLVYSVGVNLITFGVGLVVVLLGKISAELGIVGKILIIATFLLFGLRLLGVIHLHFHHAHLDEERKKRSGRIQLFGLGVLSGLVMAHHSFVYLVPFMAVSFTFPSAYLFTSLILILMFALGHSVVLIAAGLSIEGVMSLLEKTKNSKAMKWVERIFGILLILSSVFFALEFFGVLE